MAIKPKQLAILIVCTGILILAFGCSMKRTPPASLPEDAHLSREKLEKIEPVSPPVQPAQPPQSVQPPERKSDPRMMAAATLVDQGINYLDSGKPDQALDVFERALSVDPANGKTYYYMAEAWIMKKNKHQAQEFNRLAKMYLSEDSQWRAKTADQQNRIKALP